MFKNEGFYLSSVESVVFVSPLGDYMLKVVYKQFSLQVTSARRMVINLRRINSRCIRGFINR